MYDFYQKLLDLIIRTSTELPEDVEQSLHRFAQQEDKGSTGAAVMQTILKNLDLARQRVLPLCQDTGVIHFFIEANDDFPRRAFKEAAEKAVVEATRRGILRQNCVESLTGKNTGNNLGHINPTYHWLESECADGNARITLLLKGGGSENMGRQYTLPDTSLGAGRDLEGVKKCLLDAIFHAQGQGCAPGILGVAIGGDRAGGCEEAKLQLLRKIGERSTNPQLANLEQEIMQLANGSGIGPMGLGGKTTLLECFIGTRTRHPASYFVTVCYNCWCVRRQTITVDTKSDKLST